MVWEHYFRRNPQNAWHPVLLNSYFEYNVVEVAVLEERGKELSGYMRMPISPSSESRRTEFYFGVLHTPARTSVLFQGMGMPLESNRQWVRQLLHWFCDASISFFGLNGSKQSI
jgi:hypothetical protein